jgi:ketosteroid isomerase-like protein
VTDLSALDSWLDRYIVAWRRNDADTIRELFTHDAAYRWHPWESLTEGARDREEIVEAWLKEPDDPESWTMLCEPLAVNGDLGVARCVTTYGATGEAPKRRYHNILIMRLDDEGRCRDFTELFMQEPD